MKAEQKAAKKEEFAPHKPNILLYWMLASFGKFVAWALFRMRVKKDPAVKKLKGPILVLANHACAMDVSFVLTGMMPKRLNVVCGRDVFSWKPIKYIKGPAGLLPISQFATDIASLRMMKKAVEKGCSIELFPEGKISLDGRPLHYLPVSLVKLLKFLDIPVVMALSKGAYSSRPKWFKKWKRGRVEQHISVLFTQEEVREMEKKEMYARVQEAFQYNDHIFQRENNIRYKCKTPAKGLHYILFKCPKCGVEYEMESSDTHLTCNACGNRVAYTERGELIAEEGGKTFERIDLWYDYERAAMRALVEQEDFYEAHPVVWEKNENRAYTESGEGELYIDKTNIGFRGTDLQGNPVEMKAPLKHLFTIVQKNKEAVDLTIDGVVHRFYFREGKYSVKYTLLVEESFAHMNGLRTGKPLES